MAARHDAVIVPFSAVGVEDGFEVVFDADDIGQLPFGIGVGVLENARRIPSARKVDTRVTIDGAAEEAFVVSISHSPHSTSLIAHTRLTLSF